MIGMFMADEDEIGLGQSGVGAFDGIVVDRDVIPSDYEPSVADRMDYNVAVGRGEVVACESAGGELLRFVESRQSVGRKGIGDGERAGAGRHETGPIDHVRRNVDSR